MLYFTVYAGLHGRIFTKFGTNVPLVFVISLDKFYDSCSRIVILQRGSQNFHFPIETDVAVITVPR